MIDNRDWIQNTTGMSFAARIALSDAIEAAERDLATIERDEELDILLDQSKHLIDTGQDRFRRVTGKYPTGPNCYAQEEITRHGKDD